MDAGWCALLEFGAITFAADEQEARSKRKD